MYPVLSSISVFHFLLFFFLPLSNRSSLHPPSLHRIFHRFSSSFLHIHRIALLWEDLPSKTCWMLSCRTPWHSMIPFQMLWNQDWWWFSDIFFCLYSPVTCSVPRTLAFAVVRFGVWTWVERFIEIGNYNVRFRGEWGVVVLHNEGYFSFQVIFSRSSSGGQDQPVPFCSFLEESLIIVHRVKFINLQTYNKIYHKTKLYTHQSNNLFDFSTEFAVFTTSNLL